MKEIYDNIKIYEIMIKEMKKKGRKRKLPISDRAET
jgi:hypothetical protein